VSTPEVSAIVLAGGRSRRFGRDKLREPIGDRTLLEHAIAGVGPLAAQTIVVAAPDEPRNVPAGILIVRDPTSFEGPLVGLLTGLGRAAHSLVLVVGGDMPTMVPSVLGALVDQLGDPAIDAAILEHEGRGRPLPGVVRREPALAAVERLVAGGERRLRALYESLATTVIDEPAWRQFDPNGLTVRDIDTPADLS
jgi:molybdopterin-guanine dinucleotide biosynthesis protein A